ncbi:MAG: RNA-binding S4 domain-containing protein [Bacteroidetes bacterium]|nr:RNA-binding S4 domain-containing protein [Bacteroidota bacterium]
MNTPGKNTHDNRPTLQQYMKFMQLVSSGGEAKILIQGGYVLLNGETETRRGKRLNKGDQLMIDGKGPYEVSY